jgi:hypothetical protein
MDAPTNTSPQSNPNVGSAEIATASQQVDDLSRDAAWYYRWKDRADVASVLLAALIFVIAFFGNRLGAKLARANRDVTAAKERLNALQVGKVRADAEAQTSEAEKEATDANNSVGKANERASELEERPPKQNVARQKIAIRSGVANLEKDAADAKRAKLELQQMAGPRHLTQSQTQILVRELRKLGRRHLDVVLLGDQEASSFAGEISNVFAEADWALSLSRIGASSPPQYGLVLETPSAELPEAQSLVEAFRLAGLPLAVQPQRPKVELFVGLNPVR